MRVGREREVTGFHGCGEGRGVEMDVMRWREMSDEKEVEEDKVRGVW